MKALVFVHHILVLHAAILILFELFLLSYHAVSLSGISILIISCNLALSTLISGGRLLQRTFHWSVLPLYHFSITGHRMTKRHLSHRLIFLDRILFVQIRCRLTLIHLGLRICAIIVRFILTNLFMKLCRYCVL
jgi:hypothetical protein